MLINYYYFHWILIIWLILPVIIIPILFKIKAPYGRYTALKWGKMINNKLGWLIMETPSLLIFTYFFLTGKADKDFIKWTLLLLWVVHYTQRSFIYPFRLKTTGKKMPILIMSFAIIFNLMNGFLNGYYLGNISGQTYSSSSFDLKFISGLIIFVTGLVMNWKSDTILLKLRENNEPGYKIPKGGLFNYISCPNYLGEILEWVGFAIIAWNLAALSFCVWTIANLLPRAISHHRWYLDNFRDYPENRKAIIPFLL